jgi:hypothetical protein
MRKNSFMANAVMPSTTGDNSDSSDSDNDAVATAVARTELCNSASHSLGFNLHRSLLAIESYTAAATAQEGGADVSDNDDSSTLHVFHREHLSVAAAVPTNSTATTAVNSSAVLMERCAAISNTSTTATAAAAMSTPQQYRPQSPTTHTPPALSPRITLSALQCAVSARVVVAASSSASATAAAEIP